MKRRRFLTLAAALAPVEALRFSALESGKPLPADYRIYAFAGQERHTRYQLVAQEGATVLRAQADASTAGIIRDVRIDPAARPLLGWRWKVTRLPQKADLRTKAGDDYGARLYVTFDLPLSELSFGDALGVRFARLVYGGDVPAAALCYVWATRAEVGTFAPNAYTDRVRMIVVESGAARLGEWRAYERDVAADYRQAFGAAPPPVNGVVVSTDTDNTGETAEAFYGDVVFRARPTP